MLYPINTIVTVGWVRVISGAHSSQSVLYVLSRLLESIVTGVLQISLFSSLSASNADGLLAGYSGCSSVLSVTLTLDPPSCLPCYAVSQGLFETLLSWSQHTYAHAMKAGLAMHLD